MKRTVKIILSAAILSTMFTACGKKSSNSASSYDSAIEMQANSAVAGKSISDGAGMSDGYSASSEQNYTADTPQEERENADNSSQDSDNTDELKPQEGDNGVISPKMLVYSGSINIETTDFDNSLSSLRKLITSNDGFIETEQLTNRGGKNTSRTYIGTVRVPSKNYSAFMQSSQGVGTVTSQNSNALNLSQEYSESAKALEIYEAKQARYIEQIKTIKDEQALIQLEDRLTDIQVTIARLKTRMREIETDVAYSTIDISLTEVKLIDSSIDDTQNSSFSARLKNAFKESADNFLEFCEDALFGLIAILPGLLVIVLMLFILKAVIKAVIKYIKKKAAHKKHRSESSTTDNTKI